MMTATTSLSNGKPRNGVLALPNHLSEAPVRHASEPAPRSPLQGPDPSSSSTPPKGVRNSPQNSARSVQNSARSVQNSARSVETEISRVSFDPVDSASSSASPSGAVTPTPGDDKRSPLFPSVEAGEIASSPQVRLVQKQGEYNVRCTTERACDCGRLLADLFTTLVELRWRYIGLLFVAVFTVSWLLFGFAWWGVVVAHEDHLHENDTDWKPCLSNVYSLPDALLFSIDLQSTMGYGFGEIETACPGAIGFFMLQSVFGVFIECVATGIVFSKLIRPKRRFRTIMFTDKAVVCRQPSGQMALQFRVGDMRHKCLIAATVSAVVVKTVWTREGEQLPLCQHALDVNTESDDGAAFLVWPETVTHILDEGSPLAGLKEEGLVGANFEIIVLLEGTDDTTGMATQLRTSYLPSEILWGQRLAPLLIRPLSNGTVSVDYSQFNAVFSDADNEAAIELKQLALENNNDVFE